MRIFDNFIAIIHNIKNFVDQKFENKKIIFKYINKYDSLLKIEIYYY